MFLSIVGFDRNLLKVLLLMLALRYVSRVIADRGVSIQSVIRLCSQLIGYMVFIFIFNVSSKVENEYSPYVSFLLYAAIFLGILNEYKKIGDNISKITGEKYFIFEFVRKIFDIIEESFINRFKSKTK